MSDGRPTVWVFGDQCNRQIASLADRQPGDCRILFVESTAKLASKRWHVQRAHLVLSTMAHFAAELRARGSRSTNAAPHARRRSAAHVDEFNVHQVVAMAPLSWDGRALLERLGVEIVENDQFLCSYQDFAEWAGDHRHFKLEDFYRWQRQRLDC